MDWGEEAARRLTRIAEAASLPGPGVTRLPFTEEHRVAMGIITGWMEAAGLSVQMDAAGTLVGRREGPAGAKTLLIGSHQDSVPGGGAYDGIMGVVLGCLALEAVKDRPLNVAVEVLAFADEEGVRFPTALMGPRVLAGTFDAGTLAMQDRDGVSLRDALAGFGGEPDGLAQMKRRAEEIAGYLELHIEQGPVLEREDAALGLVTGICGIERLELRFTGSTGHAGTVPMDGRQDALVAAGRFVAEVPGMAREWDGLRATVGMLKVSPGAPNAIPDAVSLVLEVRSERDAERGAAVAEMGKRAAEIAERTGCGFEMEQTYQQPAVLCDPALSDVLARAGQGDLPTLPSGATHDASAMADLCPIAMLFVRCRDGVSHRPDEFASAADMGAAVDVLARALVSYEPA